MAGTVSSAELHRVLVSGTELALLDAREQGVYSLDHLFWAVSVPLSQLELLVASLVPRRDCPVVWCDAGEGLAERAATRMAGLGWTAVSVLDGGISAWPGVRYSGVNVPSKAFGEWIEHHESTPHIPAEELVARVAAGEDLVILDSRPFREFQRMSIPGGIDCPGAELAYRVHEVAPSPTTTIVVNCAGRTRSIIGAQSLRNAGVANPVIALKDGTMGWELAGLELAYGETTVAPPPSEGSLHVARARAAAVAARFGVRTVDEAELAAWQADPTRTTFVLDVRTAQEYAAGHRPGAIHAPGGQVVQATDEFVGVRGARVVLVDGDAVRATMTASWLIQLNAHEVAVLAASAGLFVETGFVADVPAGGLPDVVTVDAAELTGTETIIDLADSLRYRNRGHLPGAWWAVRSRLGEAAAVVGRTGTPADVVLTSPDGVLAALAQQDAAAVWPSARVRVLRGGTAGWAGSLETGFERATTKADDVWYKPYDADDRQVALQHMRDYLSWEIELLERIEADDTVAFRFFPR